MHKLLILAVLALSLNSFAENYKLDPSHSEIGFSVKHLLISNVKGRFEKFSGTFEYDKAAKTLKNLSIEIDPSSISTNQKNRDEHLKSADFFEVNKYKKITFKSEKADFSADGKTVKVLGKLLIRDKELPVTLDVTLNGEAEIEGVKKIAFSATTEINRKNWGLNWNKTLDQGGVAVSEEVKIMIEGEANVSQEKPKEVKTKAKTK
jgi:polyisoprenoid-binding protein YceI